MSPKEQEAYLRNNDWYYTEPHGWAKRGAFIDGKLTAADAIKLQEIIDSWFKEDKDATPTK